MRGGWKMLGDPVSSLKSQEIFLRSDFFPKYF